MDVEVVDTLAAFFPIVDNCAVPRLSEALLLGDLGADDHQVPQKLFVPLFSLRNSREPVSVLWDDQEMSFCNRCNVTEREALLVFVDNGSWDLFGHYLVENCHFFSLSCLGFLLLAFHIFFI